MLAFHGTLPHCGLIDMGFQGTVETARWGRRFSKKELIGLSRILHGENNSPIFVLYTYQPLIRTMCLYYYLSIMSAIWGGGRRSHNALKKNGHPIRSVLILSKKCGVGRPYMGARCFAFLKKLNPIKWL